MSDNFLEGTSAAYLEDLEKKFLEDPSSVDKSWAAYLQALVGGRSPASLVEGYQAFQGREGSVAPIEGLANSQGIQESMRLLLLLRAYQVQGHLAANLDPLGLDPREPPIELDPALYGFTEADLDREFFLGTWKMKGFLSEDRPVRTLRDIMGRLKQTYCGTVGYEYMHIGDRDKCNWLRERIEAPTPPSYGKQRKLRILDRLAWSEMFENFLSTKYTAAKRFGLEGGETLIPGMKALIDRASELGVESVSLGMPHRGRLNVLANVVRKPLPAIFSEFQGGVKPDKDGGYTGSGDVKYHLGTSYDRPTYGGGMMHISLVANPSHLEAVNTVVLGKVRAKQHYINDVDRAKVMPILLHGDGAFSGQGIVYETLDMSALSDYTVGGTVHIVVNNQVAFTTDPKSSRSSPYCTDVAKGLNAPIFHVNGDDVEAVAHVCELAAEWRQAWKSDVVIDLTCYRKFGHNEIDEPSFTQPLMYQTIRKHVSAHQQYAEKLVTEGTVSADEVKSIQQGVKDVLAAKFEEGRTYEQKKGEWLTSFWSGFKSPVQLSQIRPTGVNLDLLKKIGMGATEVPEHFNMHRAVRRVYEGRRKMIESAEGIDWAFAEALAFGTLMAEGNHVRLSGQDVERGTFGHRHAVVHDQKTGERFVSLKNLPVQSEFSVSNSSLSEFGVLGFELGYSMEHPNSLVIWEAQFGDFANSAQVIIDQFISSGEAKWLRQSGLVMLLPHGYDGQGPEHSSARMERYLQMCDDNPFEIPDMDKETRMQVQSHNWQVVNCTTPANYFHLLRRQVHREFRKPLIVMSPKNLLRHPAAKSRLDEFDDVETNDLQGCRFRRLIMDASAKVKDPKTMPIEPDFKRVVFCSGKVYYELAAEREKLGLNKDVAICRIEQLAPFPYDLVGRELNRYPNAEVMWCQEEPMNMGAFHHILPRMTTLMKSKGRAGQEIKYSGRDPSAATATGFGEVHAREQAGLLEEALTL
ncbi:hypothetical protein CYMTET_34209 [Cymbomonas tetramitiformis]|uniref:2-oxoglutarate dehydrogenase, mitochondrial n=1 Tax=Cymbomonas tetramitiformis TaxID=36881 RepID=A0AAE0FBP6_9CHLO|nr:hypothetical protein CYMTET_34209 [Cymbomonas tetramitiformis]